MASVPSAVFSPTFASPFEFKHVLCKQFGYIGKNTRYAALKLEWRINEVVVHQRLFRLSGQCKAPFVFDLVNPLVALLKKYPQKDSKTGDLRKLDFRVGLIAFSNRDSVYPMLIKSKNMGLYSSMGIMSNDPEDRAFFEGIRAPKQTLMTIKVDKDWNEIDSEYKFKNFMYTFLVSSPTFTAAKFKWIVDGKEQSTSLLTQHDSKDPLLTFDLCETLLSEYRKFTYQKPTDVFKKIDFTAAIVTTGLMVLSAKQGRLSLSASDTDYFLKTNKDQFYEELYKYLMPENAAVTVNSLSSSDLKENV